MIALLKKGLRVLEPKMEFEDSTCRSVQKEVLEEEVKTEKSCGLKTNELCMFAGTVWGDDQALEFVQEELNLKTIQIDAEIARSQEKMKTEEAENDKYYEKESSDAFAVTVQEKILVDAEEENQSEAQIGEVTADTVEHFDMQTESLCMNAGDDDMLQQCYREIALLEYLLKNSEYDREMVEEKV